MSTRKPSALESLSPDRLVHLDVHEDIESGREPFARIMATVQGLEAGQVFALRAPFEPVPLYAVLGKRGFAHWSEARAADDWTVYFWREPELLTVDVRGLEPPLPMTRILELLDGLATGQRLVVAHERRPMLLYPQLDDRGFRHQTEELGPGEFRITIWREGQGS